MNFDDMMKQMRIKYLEEASSKVSELQTLVDQKNFTGLESFFHKLKGSGASYGLPEFSEFGAKYELKAKNSELSDSELNALVKELEALCDTHS